jgi:hypothetical protein
MLPARFAARQIRRDQVSHLMEFTLISIMETRAAGYLFGEYYYLSEKY